MAVWRKAEIPAPFKRCVNCGADGIYFAKVAYQPDGNPVIAIRCYECRDNDLYAPAK